MYPRPNERKKEINLQYVLVLPWRYSVVSDVSFAHDSSIPINPSLLQSKIVGKKGSKSQVMTLRDWYTVGGWAKPRYSLQPWREMNFQFVSLPRTGHIIMQQLSSQPKTNQWMPKRSYFHGTRSFAKTFSSLSPHPCCSVRFMITKILPPTWPTKIHSYSSKY